MKYRMSEEEAVELREICAPLKPVSVGGEVEWAERGGETFEDVHERALAVWKRMAERLGVIVETIRRDSSGRDELDITADPI